MYVEQPHKMQLTINQCNMQYTIVCGFTMLSMFVSLQGSPSLIISLNVHGPKNDRCLSEDSKLASFVHLTMHAYTYILKLK